MEKSNKRPRDIHGRWIPTDKTTAYNADKTNESAIDLTTELDKITSSDLTSEAKFEASIDLIKASGLDSNDRARLLVEIAGSNEPTDESSRALEQKRLRHELLPEQLGELFYIETGREIEAIFGVQSIAESTLDSEITPEATPHLATLDPAVRREVIGLFSDLGLVKTTQPKDDSEPQMQLAKDAHKKLRAGSFISTRNLANHLSEIEKTDGNHTDDIDSLYEKHDENRKVKTVRITNEKDSYTILPIGEMRIGHQDSRAGHQLVRNHIARLKETPEDQRPDVILASNLIQGDFSHAQSKKRAALAVGLDSNNAQFREAKKLIDEMKSLDIPVVLNLGSDDLRIAEDYTKDVVQEIGGILREGSKSGFIPYYEQNKLTQNRRFQEHYRFQLDYALPLCYQLGRRLRTADEIQELTGGRVDQSEYLLLYRHIKSGDALPPELELDPDDIVKSGDEYPDGSHTVDDVDLVFTTNSGEHLVKYRHSTGLTPESLPGNHMDTQLKTQGNLGMMGLQLAELNISGRAQEMTYATASRVGVLSLPGLADPINSLDTRSLHREVSGDVSKRFNATRKRLIKPALDTVEMMDNGNIKHNISSAKLMEKAGTLPRMAIFEVCDMQIGSPTARQDYQIKYLSMILDKAKDMPVAIHFAGDIIHGNIYANMAHEAQSIGLLRPESQKMAVSTMLHNVFDEAPRELLNSVIDVVVQQGNHDEIQRVKSFGGGNNDSNIDYLIRDARDIFETPETKGEKVRHGGVMMTDSGTPLPTWRAYSHYGDMSVATAHYHINRGMKGNSGGMPVYHPHQRAQGIGNAENLDLILGAHWHNEQIAVIGDIVSVVGGAMAERSEFEDMFGYDARAAGTIIEMGGGQPLSVEFVHEKAFFDQQIKHGFYTAESLADHGFHDDKG
ncbi:MAG TPA: metallophosphoesterase, partial [Candidatus Saccharimonadales bacterium]|nr:metallophosphoesterase [Candidatus Saccharimonadales bacterium]